MVTFHSFVFEGKYLIITYNNVIYVLFNSYMFFYLRVTQSQASISFVRTEVNYKKKSRLILIIKFRIYHFACTHLFETAASSAFSASARNTATNLGTYEGTFEGTEQHVAGGRNWTVIVRTVPQWGVPILTRVSYSRLVPYVHLYFTVSSSVRLTRLPEDFNVHPQHEASTTSRSSRSPWLIDQGEMLCLSKT